MRYTPLLAAFTLAAGLVGFSAVSGQPPTGKADKSAAAELAKFRGEWSITKIEFPVDAPGGPSGIPDEFLKGVALSVTENRVSVTIRVPGGRDDKGYILLKLDPAHTPAHIDLTDATEKFEPRRSLPTTKSPSGKAPEPLPVEVLKGIYKFEGDGLVLALPTQPEVGRPTAFKTVVPKNLKGSPAERGGVAVLYLSKKK